MQRVIAKVLKHEYTWDVNLPDDTPPLYLGAIRKGFQEWLQDAASTAKGWNKTPDGGKVARTATAVERELAVQERMLAIRAGTYIQAGKGGRGGSLSDDDEALHRWLTQRGHKGAKKDLAERLLSFCRLYVAEAEEGEALEALMAPENAAELTELAKAAQDEVMELIVEQDDYKDILGIVEKEKELGKAAVVLVAKKTGLRK